MSLRPARYRLFGLGVECNQPLPGLEPVPDQEVGHEERLSIHLAEGQPARDPRGWSLHAESSLKADCGATLLRVERRPDGEQFRFAYHDGTVFRVDRQGRRVEGSWRPPLTLEDTAVYLLGPVLGFVLRLRGHVPLHASAATVDGRAVAFCGPAGAGKSTLAASFVRAGSRALCDDISVVRRHGGGFQLVPDVPRLRLWPESARLLFGDAEALPPLTPNWDKRGLALDRRSFEPAPLALAAIYLLRTRAAGERPAAGPLSPRDALLGLVANTYATHLIDGAMRRAELDLLADLVHRVPVRRLRRSADGDPAEVRRLVERDLAPVLGSAR